MTHEEFKLRTAIAEVCGTICAALKYDFQLDKKDLIEIHNKLAAAAGFYNWIEELQQVLNQKNK